MVLVRLEDNKMKKFTEAFTEDQIINEGLLGNIWGGIKNLAKSAASAYMAGYRQTAAETSRVEADIAKKKMPSIIQGITDKITADTKTINDSIDKTLKQDPNAYGGASKDIIVAAIINASLDAALSKLQSEALTECFTRAQRKAIMEGILGKIADKIIGKGTSDAYKAQKIVWSKNDTQKIGNDLAMYLQKQSTALVSELESAIQKDPTAMKGKKPKKEAFNLITDAINIIKANLGKTAGVEVAQFPKLPDVAPETAETPEKKEKTTGRAKSLEAGATADIDDEKHKAMADAAHGALSEEEPKTESEEGQKSEEELQHQGYSEEEIRKMLKK
jgi:SOS response regulatory protein OraA/RecX